MQLAEVCAVAAPLPLAGLAGDVATVERLLQRACRPVVLVGHGWGGTVITAAGDSDAVAGLVYIAAYAPEAGRSTDDLLRNSARPEHVRLLEEDDAGYVWFPQANVQDWIAQDLPAPNARALAATQRPILRKSFDQPCTGCAWRSKPSWYLTATRDRIVPPALQHRMAVRIGAREHAVQASRAVHLSCPKESAAVILEAVAAIP